MPGESIAAYINNITAFAIFTAVVLFIFFLMFLLSRFLIVKSKSKNNKIGVVNGKMTRGQLTGNDPGGASSCMLYLKKDPYLLKNLFIFSLLFIFNILFIFFIVLVLGLAREFQIGRDLFLILGFSFFLLVASVYIIKSKIFK